MLIKSVFKCIFCKTVVIDSVTGGILFQSASNLGLILGFLFRQDSVVVRFYHFGKIRQTTAANFDIVSVEYFVELVGFWKMLVNKF